MNRPSSTLLFAALLIAGTTGCRSNSTASAAASPAQQAENRAKLEMARDDIAHIPPPSKNLYMNVRSLGDWENPILTVQQDMITVTVMRPDANPSELGKGTMLRPAAARKDVVTIRPASLVDALNAIPREAWPYGRVVAIEEAHNAPKSAQPELRRHIESAMQTLSDLGIVADEWSDQRPVGIR